MPHTRSTARAAVGLDTFNAAVLAGTAERMPVRALVRFAASEATGEDAAADTRTIPFVLSDGSVDSYNTTLDPNGWDFDRSGAGTVVLYGHNPSDVMNVVGRCHNVRVADGRLVGDVTFAAAEVNPRAEAVYQLVRGGFINSCSVGFDPIEWSPSKTRKGGVDFKRQELLELSIVPIPSNKNALALARAAGIDVGQLPPVQTRAVGRMLTRDLYDVSTFSSVVQWLAYLTSSTAWEAEYEGDGSEIPGRLAELLKAAGAIMVDMTAEEVGELIASVTGEAESRAAGAAFARGVAQRVQRSADPQTVITGALLANRERRQMALDAFDAVMAGEANFNRAGKVLSGANETALREAHELMTRAAETVLSVAGSNTSADDPDDDASAEERAKAATAARLRRAQALQRRALLTPIEAA